MLECMMLTLMLAPHAAHTYTPPCALAEFAAKHAPARVQVATSWEWKLPVRSRLSRCVVATAVTDCTAINLTTALAAMLRLHSAK